MNVREHPCFAHTCVLFGSVLAEAPSGGRAVSEAQMPDHAGFAAAITLREHVLNEALLFAYSRPSFSRELTIPFLGTGPPVLLQAFLSPPTVTCDTTRDAIVVGLDLPGKLTITASTGVESHPVLAHVEIAV